jgi:hypothetical protein
MTSLVDLLALMQADMPRVASERKEYKPSRWSRPKFLAGTSEFSARIDAHEIDVSMAIGGARAGHRYLFEEHDS